MNICPYCSLKIRVVGKWRSSGADTGLEQRYVLSFFNSVFEIISNFNQKAEEVKTHMSLLCSRLLETVLGYISAVAQSVERNADKLTGKFLQHLSRAYDSVGQGGRLFLSIFCVLLLQLCHCLVLYQVLFTSKNKVSDTFF